MALRPIVVGQPGLILLNTFQNRVDYTNVCWDNVSYSKPTLNSWKILTGRIGLTKIPGRLTFEKRVYA